MLLVQQPILLLWRNLPNERNTGSSIAREKVVRLKQESTRQIWLLHPTLLRKQYWYQHILWSDGYFACSIGEAAPETISQYIHSQG
jgi:REP element-mobilizing transposase RayT